MLEKTRGIVLHHLKYGDSSLIAHIYTLNLGRRSFLIKGARTKKSKSKTNLFQSLNILNLEYNLKENNQLLVLREADRAKSLNHFPYDIKKSSQAMFMAEVLHRCLIEEAPDNDLYNFLENSIEYFDIMEEDSSNFHLAFLVKLSQFLGIQPSVVDEDNRKTLAIRENDKNTRTKFQTGSPFSNNSHLSFQLFQEGFKNCSRHKLSREQRNNLLEEILSFYTFNGFKLDTLKSLDVLKTLFSP